MKKLIWLTLLLLLLTGCQKTEKIPYWTEDSPTMASVISFVAETTDAKSPAYVPPEKRIAVFDMDGTLYGELFPTYFDECLLLHRLLHDESYQASPEDRAWARSAESALLAGEPEPDSPRSGAQMAAEAFRGFTLEAYREYIRAFMEEPVAGFSGMSYGEGFYLPMTALVQYLAEHGFTVFISSGSERTLVRELIAEELGEWIPPHQVIGSTFSLIASGQGEKEGRKYTYAPDDQVLLEGNLTQKNQQMNKVITRSEKRPCWFSATARGMWQWHSMPCSMEDARICSSATTQSGITEIWKRQPLLPRPVESWVLKRFPCTMSFRQYTRRARKRLRLVSQQKMIWQREKTRRDTLRL